MREFANYNHTSECVCMNYMFYDGKASVVSVHTIHTASLPAKINHRLDSVRDEISLLLVVSS